MFELYLFATVMSLFLALGLNVVISHNPVYSILYLVLFFVTGSSILALFGFDYLSLIFVLVYVGAIAVLFLFVVMILDIKTINKSGFDATFLVLLSLLLFCLPLVYHCGLFILLINNLFFESVFLFYLAGFCDNMVIYAISDLFCLLLDSKIFSELFKVYYETFLVLENYLCNLELQACYSMGSYDYFILLKHLFCKYGFMITESEILLYDSFQPLKIDYDSSVKNFQILYTDFTSLFIVCGGVLLIAMTSCISLALPSRQLIVDRYVRRRFQY
ncbi:unnamed protein product [Dictyota dichotoma]|uniref:NADH-ubiquinone oxidoreductase chain 6 n=1 Tax=Dictyota dichotoma TaxID=2876 RepID=Q2TUA1_DICDH|nr:NADH dehydrogenase subunit 6 [Dictyota dichotoma]AAS79093.1 NADH dehydrogenase subunit 6 [Dictyota dichotoma]